MFFMISEKVFARLGPYYIGRKTKKHAFALSPELIGNSPKERTFLWLAKIKKPLPMGEVAREA